jgi:hypothetical protein
MKFKTKIAVATLAVAASTLFVWSEPGENHTPTIEGVWRVTRGGVNCNNNQALEGTFPALMTFHSDGTLTGSAKSPVTGPFDTAEHGVWNREPGAHNYSFRDVSYRYDGSGAFAGSLVVTANVELTDANSFVYNSTIQIVGANGNLIASHCGRASGTRF